MILLWRTLALLLLALGIIGAFLPLLPTVPFLIAAAWCAGKGWPRLESWMLNHPVFGHSIRQWRAHGAVPRRAKWLASMMMASSALMLQFIPLPEWGQWTRWGVPFFLLCVALWLWRCPEPKPDSSDAA